VGVVAVGVTSTGGRNPSIRVLIVDDDALVRAGLAMMLGAAADLEVVGEAEDGTQVAAAIDAHRPDVVLMDIRMPKLDGLAATRLVRARPHPPEVIVLTTFDVDEHVLTALRDGAAGFLVKDTPPTEILDAIRVVAAGDAILSPTVTRKLIDFMAADGAPAISARATELLGELTEREREVAAAVGHGSSNAEIAAELFMSVATVKAHVSRLLSKLDLDNRVQIALLVHDAGLSSS
jgi:DNA-binding NarL/FixJ family response regulator